jgi:hypothetical protein
MRREPTYWREQQPSVVVTVARTTVGDSKAQTISPRARLICDVDKKNPPFFCATFAKTPFFKKI